MITHILRLFLARTIKPFVFRKGVENDLNFDVKNLGLYVHIPFCEKICPFCPYYKIKYEEELSKKFKNSLIKEIDLIGKLLHRKKEIISVYFGGGTPALMVDDLAKIIQKFKEYFEIQGNTGIELHPRDIDENLMNKLKDAGFNMVGIGIQSFQNKCLSTLGREWIDGINKLKIAQKTNFNAIDVDFIFGIPSQTEEDIEKDFMIAVENGATQISTYPFIDFSYANNKNKPLEK